MAAESRGTGTGLIKKRPGNRVAAESKPETIGNGLVLPKKSLGLRLFEEGYAFSFFQAIRLLEQCFPDKIPVGHEGPQENEVVHFRAYQDLTFPASQIYSLDLPAKPEEPAEMVVTFLGLTGPSGILPRHYTEMIMRLEREARGPERTALRDWLDIFNHRLLSLFYRAWTKYRFFIPYQRREYALPQPDAFTQALYSAIGMGTPGLRNRLRVAYWDSENPEQPDRTLARIEDLSLIFYSGLLSQRPRGATALRALLEDYFQIPVEVKQFHGQWLQLDPLSYSCLGEGEANNALGLNTVAGERVWDVLGRIRLRLGPLTYREFTQFIPDRSISTQRKAFFLLAHLVRWFTGMELSFDVQILLKAPEIPECSLPNDEDAVGALLGWNTWLTSQEAEFDAQDAIFEGEVVTWINDDERLAARG